MLSQGNELAVFQLNDNFSWAFTHDDFFKTVLMPELQQAVSPCAASGRRWTLWTRATMILFPT